MRTVHHKPTPRHPPRQSAQRVARDAEGGPFVDRDGAERTIEADRRFVPVEHRPLEAAAAAGDGDFGEMHQQRPADALAAVCRPHEEILEPEPSAAEEGRVGVEEERKAGGAPVDFGNHDLGGRHRPEERGADPLLCRDDLVGESFVLGKPADQVEDQRDVGNGGGAERGGSHGGY